jgi:hypothetical protein
LARTSGRAASPVIPTAARRSADDLHPVVDPAARTKFIIPGQANAAENVKKEKHKAKISGNVCIEFCGLGLLRLGWSGSTGLSIRLREKASVMDRHVKPGDNGNSWAGLRRDAQKWARPRLGCSSL